MIQSMNYNPTDFPLATFNFVNFPSQMLSFIRPLLEKSSFVIRSGIALALMLGMQDYDFSDIDGYCNEEELLDFIKENGHQNFKIFDNIGRFGSRMMTIFIPIKELFFKIEIKYSPPILTQQTVLFNIPCKIVQSTILIEDYVNKVKFFSETPYSKEKLIKYLTSLHQLILRDSLLLSEKNASVLLDFFDKNHDTEVKVFQPLILKNYDYLTLNLEKNEAFLKLTMFIEVRIL
jgi:hypothetical protein